MPYILLSIIGFAYGKFQKEINTFISEKIDKISSELEIK